ncbi:hypothetical protein [Bifidobacterium catulorum]|uniref:hypothetical protein n=1 Tax=Bifidobacterium catulorum TaxID=1630173 RepID=UPI0013049885|nr:hypothetical protein [Bifidobacterium catulorum]
MQQQRHPHEQRHATATPCNSSATHMNSAISQQYPHEQRHTTTATPYNSNATSHEQRHT